MARAGVTAERLTQAAADLADEVGFANVTVSALARRFGVTDPSLYSHIRNAQDLRVRVAVLALAELGDRVAAALAGRAGKDALAAFANAYRDYAKEHPGRYAATQIGLGPETAATSAAGRHAEMTRAILRGYELSEPDQTDAVRLLHSTLHGYVSLETAGGFHHHPREVEASWSRALDALDVVLRNWPPALAGAGDTTGGGRMSRPRPHPASTRINAAAACPCGLPATYTECCGRFHAGRAAPTAEALMRSRFAAFAVEEEAYLLRTWHPSTRPAGIDFEPGMRWTELEIEATSGGSPIHTTGTVTFRARYTYRGKPGELHEQSRFARHEDAWVYLDAIFTT
jgi:uncharacterized protein YchJ/AcrR family transcriptional regulator